MKAKQKMIEAFIAYETCKEECEQINNDQPPSLPEKCAALGMLLQSEKDFLEAHNEFLKVLG